MCCQNLTVFSDFYARPTTLALLVKTPHDIPIKSHHTLIRSQVFVGEVRLVALFLQYLQYISMIFP
jgi:hypothetical protein